MLQQAKRIVGLGKHPEASETASEGVGTNMESRVCTTGVSLASLRGLVPSRFLRFRPKIIVIEGMVIGKG